MAPKVLRKLAACAPVPSVSEKYTVSQESLVETPKAKQTGHTAFTRKKKHKFKLKKLIPKTFRKGKEAKQESRDSAIEVDVPEDDFEHTDEEVEDSALLPSSQPPPSRNESVPNLPTSTKAAVHVSSKARYQKKSVQNQSSSSKQLYGSETTIHTTDEFRHEVVTEVVETRTTKSTIVQSSENVRKPAYSPTEGSCNVGTPSSYVKTDLKIRRIEHAENVWYSSHTKQFFEELPLPGDGIFQYSTSDSLVLNQVRTNLWYSEDRRLFQLAPIPPRQAASALSECHTIMPRETPAQSIQESNQRPMEAASANFDTEINSRHVNQLSYSDSLKKISHPTEEMRQAPTTLDLTPVLPSMDDLKATTRKLTDPSEVQPVSPEGDGKPQKLKSTASTLSPTTPAVQVCTAEDTNTPEELITGPVDRNLDSVFNDLDIEDSSRQVVAPNYTELLSNIAELLVYDEEVIAPLYCLSPKDPRKLLIQGPRVSKYKEQILSLSKESNFETTISENEPVMTTTQNRLPIYTKTLGGDDPTMPYHLHKDETTHIATIGAFVKDDKMIRRGLVFGITAAHAVLNRDEQDQLTEWDANPDAIKARIEAVFAKRSIGGDEYSICPHSRIPIYVNDAIMTAYNAMIPTPEYGQDRLEPFMKFACDIALLPVDAEKIDRKVAGEAANASFISTHTGHASMENIDRPLKQTRIAGYIDIKTPEDIDKLREGRVKIIVCGVVGELQEQPTTFTQATIRRLAAGPSASNTIENRSVQKHMIASHFAFTTRKALYHGQSGSPVFVYNKARDVFYIIGLLMGSFRGAVEWCQDTLYQAMPFAPALKLMQFVYDQKLRNVRPITSESAVLSADASVSHLSHHNDVNDDDDTGFQATTFSLDESHE